MVVEEEAAARVVGKKSQLLRLKNFWATSQRKATAAAGRQTAAGIAKQQKADLRELKKAFQT